MNYVHTFNSMRYALVTTTLIVFLGISTFFAFEPSVGRSQEEFLVSQTITDEVSFRVAPADVTMVGSIQGLTGGYATGTTMAVVTTNDPQGYSMSLIFSSSTAMNRNNGASFISNYTPASTTGGVPDLTWVDNVAGGSGEFGYTVRASTTAEVDQSFMHNGTNCNAGSTEANDRCWANPSTTAERIVGSTAPVTFSTTTIKFKVAVPSNPSPILPSGVYVATGTLTIVGNP